MMSPEGIPGISTSQAQRRAKGKIMDKPLCLTSFGNDTYLTPQNIFFSEQENTQ